LSLEQAAKRIGVQDGFVGRSHASFRWAGAVRSGRIISKSQGFQ
jgi:hypothetical protein